VLFVGAVFYVFTAVDFGSSGKMSGSRLLPDAAGPASEDPKLNSAPSSLLPASNPVVPPKNEPSSQTAETPEIVETAEITPISPSPAAEPEPEDGAKTHIVSIESSGFTPKLITITVGDTVRWVNNNSKLHWPASDPHPTHTGLSDFDPFADLLPGETFSYTFKTGGAFSYHDHTQAVVEDVATLTGVVRVLEK
jgi:plastocyanin